MKIFVVVSMNETLMNVEAIGASDTHEGAEIIAQDNKYYFNKYAVHEVEFQKTKILELKKLQREQLLKIANPKFLKEAA